MNKRCPLSSRIRYSKFPLVGLAKHQATGSDLQNVFVQIAKCICFILQNVFVSSCKMYLFQIEKCFCLKLQNVFVLNCKMSLFQIAKLICLKLENVFVSNYKINLSQIEKCIFLKLQNVFVSNCKMYLCQIAKCICFKFQNIFVSNCKIYLSKIDCSRWAGWVATACVYPLTFIIAAEVYLTLTQIPWKSSKHF